MAPIPRLRESQVPICRTTSGQGFFLRAGEWVGEGVGDRGGGVSGVWSASFWSNRCFRVFAS